MKGLLIKMSHMALNFLFPDSSFPRLLRTKTREIRDRSRLGSCATRVRPHRRPRSKTHQPGVEDSLWWSLEKHPSLPSIENVPLCALLSWFKVRNKHPGHSFAESSTRHHGSPPGLLLAEGLQHQSQNGRVDKTAPLADYTLARQCSIRALLHPCQLASYKPLSARSILFDLIFPEPLLDNRPVFKCCSSPIPVTIYTNVL